ncbi:hypothetical protein DID88_000657 [Monilinia fructigena]|uniref:Uncharacterized protein n=1 Tax=Monilinia fructigena TaxID=38457 RepID=A0A395IIK5_9HELO|nr:hypothetical protein DID88_000657 [Monilinia fructigena]
MQLSSPKTSSGTGIPTTLTANQWACASPVNGNVISAGCCGWSWNTVDVTYPNGVTLPTLQKSMACTINKDTYTEEEEEECEEWLDTVKEQQNDDEPIVFDAKAFTTYVRFKRANSTTVRISTMFKSGIVRDFIKNNFKYKEEDDDDGDMYGGGGILMTMETTTTTIAIEAVGHHGIKDHRSIPIHNLLSVCQNSTPTRRNMVEMMTISTSKLSIFYEITRRAEVPMDMQYKAFPIMLKDSALEFFHANYESLPPTFKELCTYMRNNFEGDEYQRNMLSKWNSITQSTKKENKNKPLSECLTIMIKQLRMLQHRLDPAMRQTSHLHNKLILACEDVEDATWLVLTPRKSNNGNDRKWFQGFRNSNFRSNNFRNNSYNKSRHSNSSNQRNQCWICKKEGCRSTKHSKEEQDKQRREYREKIKGGSNNAFNKRYDQWMIEYEGEATDAESDSETEMGLFFADLDIEDDADEAFFVSSEPISGQEVFNQLSINTILHTMTRDPVEATLPTESAVDIFYTSYTSKEFYGIFTYDPQTAGAANVRFGKGTATSIGSFRVIAPFGDVDFHIVDADIPFLLSLEDMDRLKAFYNNITDQFITPNGQYSVIRRRGHAFLTWESGHESTHPRVNLPE